MLAVVDRNPGRRDMYVAGFNSNTIYDYRVPDLRNHPPYCLITAGISNIRGVGVDRDGVLWVPGQGGGGKGVVTSYASHCGTEGITLAVAQGRPVGIAFGSEGVNYVAVTDRQHGAYVAVFEKGATTPSRELRNKWLDSGLAGDAVAVDSKGNVFLAFSYPYGEGGFMEFLNGRGKGELLALGTAGLPGSVTFDSSGNMIITDVTNALLEVSPPPYIGTYMGFNLIGHSWQCALNKPETLVACADSTNGTADLYSYPIYPFGKYEYSISAGLIKSENISGLAFDPSAKR